MSPEAATVGQAEPARGRTASGHAAGPVGIERRQRQPSRFPNVDVGIFEQRQQAWARRRSPDLAERPAKLG